MNVIKFDKITSGITMVLWILVFAFGLVIVINGFKWKWPKKNDPRYNEYRAVIDPFVGLMLLIFLLIMVVDNIRYFVYDDPRFIFY